MVDGSEAAGAMLEQKSRQDGTLSGFSFAIGPSLMSDSLSQHVDDDQEDWSGVGIRGDPCWNWSSIAFHVGGVGAELLAMDGKVGQWLWSLLHSVTRVSCDACWEHDNPRDAYVSLVRVCFESRAHARNLAILRDWIDRTRADGGVEFAEKGPYGVRIRPLCFSWAVTGVVGALKAAHALEMWAVLTFGSGMIASDRSSERASGAEHSCVLTHRQSELWNLRRRCECSEFFAICAFVAFGGVFLSWRLS